MIRRLALRACILAAAFACAAAPSAAAPPADLGPSLGGALHWRSIGPFRGGRTVAVTGVPGRPHEFYLGATDGGVFKTTDGGRVWRPIFDDQPSASIGAIAVAPSAPDTVYVGSGEGRHRPDLSTGDGIYRSTDGGAHWTHLGLRDGQQIAKIVVDPHDAQRLFVSVLGHPYGANAERGVYRSTDGGATFSRVLFLDADTGAFDLALDPADANTVYATMWSARENPWENDALHLVPPVNASGLYKSSDGGTTWTHLAGLPGAAQGAGRMAVAVAPSDPHRVYAFVSAQRDAGIYRSDDAGATWHLVNATDRIVGRGDDLAMLAVDPRNPDTLYESNTSTYRSTDGGKTMIALRGAPGGDDYQSVWIAPDDPRTIALGSDQGAVISVDAGATWSSWYNQPTAQFYHVATDDRFPYRVYGGQQESGSVGILSRGNDGAITFRDWHPVGVEEYGYVAPDPLHPGIIFGGKVSRYDEHTGQVRAVGPVVGWRGNQTYRFRRTAPLAFSPAERRTLYLGANVVLRTRDYGARWDVVSPDLTRPQPPPATTWKIGGDAKRLRGVIYALAPSPRDARVLWAGTDDGLVWRTADGGAHWNNVTPPGIDPWAKISIIDASPFDAASAYVAVNRLRLDQQRPQLFRTHDGGRSWTEIDAGIDASPTNVVRADPQRRGVLYAGTERGVWTSFDDGATWSSLRLNLPAVSVRDLVVHGDDLVIGTHGRGFWILDDATLLRRAELLTAAAPAIVTPARTWRVVSNTNSDTPLPPDEPFAANPPDGAVFDYVLPRAAARVVLTVRDAHGTVVRRVASDDSPAPAVDLETLEVPSWWIEPPRRPAASAGIHRFVWDLRATAPRAFAHDPVLSESGGLPGIPGRTPLEPQGPRVAPGSYRATLEADGARTEAAFTVHEDPRVQVGSAQLDAQYAFARQIVDTMNRSYDAGSASGTEPAAAARLKRANGALADLLVTLNFSDGGPTAVQRAAYEVQRRIVDSAWRSGAAARGTK